MHRWSKDGPASFEGHCYMGALQGHASPQSLPHPSLCHQHGGQYAHRVCFCPWQAQGKAITRRYLEHVMRLSLVQDGLGSPVGLYFRDVGTHALGTVPEFYHLPLSHGILMRFLRFRLGCHHLRVNTGRWVQPPLPRRQRVCLRCHSACLDNEAHCLLTVCSHPTMVDVTGEDACSYSSGFFRHNMAMYAQSGVSWEGC